VNPVGLDSPLKDLDAEARNVYSPFMSARVAHPAGNPAYLLIESLDEPRLQLSSALYVESHWEPEGVTVHHPESDVFGYGETEADALDDFRKAFVELFLTLSSDRVALGPGLQRTLQVLDDAVQLA
jgi:hypothetical protein